MRLRSTYDRSLNPVEGLSAAYLLVRLLTLMGRTKTKTKTKTKKRIDIQLPSSSAPSIPALYEKAHELVDQCDYELAARFLRRILEQDPSHIHARDLLAVVLLELGELSNAQSVSGCTLC